MPKISVITPVFNHGHLVPRAVKSVQDQTFKDWEMILVDDGSTDDTREAIRNLASGDSRIYTHFLDINTGRAHAMNEAIKRSLGDYVAWLDADDYWHPDKLEKQLRVFDDSANPRLGMVSCHGYKVDKASGFKEDYLVPPNEKKALQYTYMKSITAVPSVMVKREVLDDVGLFDEDFWRAEDWEMWTRILLKYDLGVVREPLFTFHIPKPKNTPKRVLKEKAEHREKYFRKHGHEFSDDKRILCEWLRRDGVVHHKWGFRKKGWQQLSRAVMVNPTDMKCWASVVGACFGGGILERLGRAKAKAVGYSFYK